MSQRSFIEINHDYFRELDDPQWLADLQIYLGSGDKSFLEKWQSIKILGRRHHSYPDFVVPIEPPSLGQRAITALAQGRFDEHVAEEIAAAVPAREWIPVGERLPTDDEQPVLRVHAPCPECKQTEPYVDSGWMDQSSLTGPNEVTHWRALPPPPAAAADLSGVGTGEYTGCLAKVGKPVAALASPPHAAAEPEKPVAWMYEHPAVPGPPPCTTLRWSPRDGWTETPLYASPSVQPIAREPTECQCSHDPTPEEESSRVCSKCGKPIIV